MLRPHLVKHVQDALIDLIGARLTLRTRRSWNLLNFSTRFRISSRSLMRRVYQRFGRALNQLHLSTSLRLAFVLDTIRSASFMK